MYISNRRHLLPQCKTKGTPVWTGCEKKATDKVLSTCLQCYFTIDILELEVFFFVSLPPGSYSVSSFLALFISFSFEIVSRSECEVGRLRYSEAHLYYC